MTKAIKYALNREIRK